MRSVGYQLCKRYSGCYRPALAVLALACSLLVFSPTYAVESKRETASKPEPTADASEPPQRTILVSIRKQRLRLIEGDREITSSRISSGQPGFDTPTGVFSILEKKPYHESNIYEGAPMPFMQRITWSGIALHGGIVPGYRASHGCIRLPHSFARTFFGKTSVGGRVIITQDEVRPVAFEHDALFKPLPAETPQPVQGASNAQRLAANNQGPGSDIVLSNLVSTPAMADETNPSRPAESAKPRSRAEAVRMQAEKIETLKEQMKAAEAAKIETSEKAKLALRAASDAEAKLLSVRKPHEGVLKAAAEAEAARRAAALSYRQFLATMGKPTNEKARLAAEDKEFELENRLLDLTVDADAARANAAQAELIIADAKAQFATADAAKNAATDEARSAITDLRNIQTALIEAQKAQQRRDRTLSVFISLKSQKIYIRQGFEPIYQGVINVDDPPGAIGTHVFNATKYDPTGNAFKWQLISAQPPRLAAAEIADSGKKKKAQGVSVDAQSPINIEAARVALDAIRVPEEARDLIAELGKPGMSVIISERDLSSETGRGTEFVVLTR